MKRLFIGLVTIMCALCITPAFASADDNVPTQATKSATILSTGAGVQADSGAILGTNKVYRISTALAAADTKVLDVSNGQAKSGANIQLYQANGTLAQFWRAEYQGEGIYHLVSYKGGNLLSVSGKLVSGANVINSRNANVNWKIVRNSDNTYSLFPASAPTLCLDIKYAKVGNGTNAWLYTSNGTKAQKFYFTEFSGLTAAAATGKTAAAGVVELQLESNRDLCVDIASASKDSGANVFLSKYSGSVNQKYQLNYIGDGLYEFQNANSGKVLDVANASQKDGANVWQYNRNYTIAQYWYLVKNGEGYQIKSAVSAYGLGTKNNTVSASANVQMARAFDQQSQVFSLDSTPVVEDGTYVISSALVMPMVLDVANGSKASGANLQIYRSNGTDAQKFTIKHLGDGMYSITGVGSGNAIDVASASTEQGANVWMYSPNGTNAQKWRIELGPYGLMFKSVVSGKYLDVKNAKVKRGTNVWQYSGNNTKAQCWVLRDADWQFYPTNTNINDLRIIQKAEQYEGWPYRWGGRSPATSFDCAGLVMYCSNQVWGTNFDLMLTNADRLYSICMPISESQARPGDLVFYRGTYGSNVNYISHVVFYAGNGVMYGAGDPIGYSNVTDIKNIRKQPAKYMFARIKH